MAVDKLSELERRVKRLSRLTMPTFYDSVEDITYLAKIAEITAVFMTDDVYSKQWFYPRYSNEKLHEPVALKYLLKFLNSESVFLDVGAHLGYFSIIAAHRCKRVFAIEALEFLVNRLHRNAVANHLSNMHTVLAAAGESNGFVKMSKIGGPGNSVGAQNVQNFVPMIRLDDFFFGENLPTVLKIDTEGYELKVLQGAEEILKSKPILLVEVHDKMTAFGDTQEDLFRFLIEKGYTISACDHRSESINTFSEFEIHKNSMIICTPLP
jgi:FkbM family methyltransferase